MPPDAGIGRPRTGRIDLLPLLDTAATCPAAPGLLDATRRTLERGGRTVLDGLTQSLAAGSVGLLGPNGAGKTTLINSLLGFYRPFRGSVRILGRDVRGAAEEIRAQVGYMPESEAFVAGMSGIRFVRMMAELSGLPPAQADTVLLGVIASVLAGSVFGDHCSPISDTTILSSMAASSDLVDHVRTQLPYALTVGGVALAVGVVPTAFGVPPLLALAVGGALLALILRLAGRKTG